MADRLVLPTSDHGVAGSNPAGGEILPEPKRRFIAQSLSCSPFHRLEMTEILLKGRKTLTHPSIILFLDSSKKLCCNQENGVFQIRVTDGSRQKSHRGRDLETFFMVSSWNP